MTKENQFEHRNFRYHSARDHLSLHSGSTGEEALQVGAGKLPSIN